jgi:hypothetical protein
LTSGIAVHGSPHCRSAEAENGLPIRAFPNSAVQLFPAWISCARYFTNADCISKFQLSDVVQFRFNRTLPRN